MEVNRNGLAELMEVSTATIDAWLRKGAPYTRKARRGVPWKFNVAQVVNWLLQRESGRFDSKSLTDQRCRETRLRADLLQVRLDIETGRALPLEETQLVWTNIVSSARAAFLAIPSRVAPQAVGMTAHEIEDLARLFIYEALDQLGSGDELPDCCIPDEVLGLEELEGIGDGELQ